MKNQPSKSRPQPALCRYVLYARKSTEGEDRQVQSIPDQCRLARKHAEEQGLTVVREITEARSAKAQGARSGFKELIGMIERGEADAILAWHPDRLARNAIDGGWILDLLDRGRLKELRFLSYTFENTPEGKFMLGMLFSKSKYDVDKLSVDVRRGMQSKRDAGIFPHRAPEGYVNDIATHTIQPDPERFPVLRRVIEEILSGTVIPSKALATLNGEWGYRTRPTANGKGGPLSRTSFYDMLSNPFYYGVCIERDQVYPGIHKPLLTEREFWQVQDILRAPDKAVPKKHVFPFTGLMRCGRCGCKITATLAKGHAYYHCTNALGVCDRKGVREENVELQVRDWLVGVSIPEWLEDLLADEVRRETARRRADTKDDGKRQKTATATIERQLSTLLSLRLRELINDEEYARQKATLDAELAAARLNNIDTGTDAEDAEATVFEMLTYASHAMERFDASGPDERRAIARRLGAKHNLTGGKLLLKLDPMLSLFFEDRELISTFKPPKSGFQSTKRTDKSLSVLHGWTCRMAIELCNSTNR